MPLDYHSRRPSGRVAPLFVLLLMILIGTAGVLGILYYKTIIEPAREQAQELQATMLRMTHLSQPVSNTLDKSRFRDDDNDDVADPPKDAAYLIDPPILYFNYIPDDTASEAAKVWQPFIDHLAKVTGKTVRYLPLATVDEQLAALRNGRLHIAGLNTGAVAIAVNLCGFVPVAKLPGPRGNGSHQMEIIVPASGPIQTLDDLRGHELTLTAVGSSSGYRAPLVLLKDKGLMAPTDYQLRYSGGHDASILGVAHKEFEAAAVANDMLARALAAGIVQANQIRSVYSSPSFPNAGIGYAYNLAPSLAANVRQAILEFDAANTPLQSYVPPGAPGPMHFVPANYKEDWALVRSTDNAIGYRYKLEAAAPESAPTPATRTSTRP